MSAIDLWDVLGLCGVALTLGALQYGWGAEASLAALGVLLICVAAAGSMRR